MTTETIRPSRSTSDYPVMVLTRMEGAMYDELPASSDRDSLIGRARALREEFELAEQRPVALWGAVMILLEDLVRSFRSSQDETN